MLNLRSCKKSFEDYKEGLDIDPTFNNLKGSSSLRVGLGIIPNGGLVLKDWIN